MAPSLPDLDLGLPGTTCPKVTRGEITYWSVEHHNVQVMKLIFNKSVPDRWNYDDAFCENAVKCGEWSQFALFNGLNVSAVSMRKESQSAQGTALPVPVTDGYTKPTSKGPARMHIVALGVLERYRRFGLGTALLRHVEYVSKKDRDVLEIYARVKVKTEEGEENSLEFWKHLGYDVLMPGVPGTDDYPGDKEEAVVRKLTNV